MPDRVETTWKKRNSFIMLVLATLFGGAIFAFLAGGPTTAAAKPSAAQPVATPCAAAAFNQVLSPNPSDNNVLYGVSAVGPNDAWAVGAFWPPVGASQQTLIQRWNGSTWTTVPSPNPSSLNVLRGVAVVSSNDVWAVGYYQQSGPTYDFRPLILHWDGAQWSVMPLNIDFGASSARLYGVTVVDANQVWAVGKRGSIPMTLRWDGTQWTEDVSGRVAPVGTLLSVTAAGPNEVWAAGYAEYEGFNRFSTLTARWNGTSWTRVASPNAGTSDPANFLRSISASGSNNVWAVGYYQDYSRGGYSSLTMRWNGSAWIIVPSPNPNGGNGAPKSPGGFKGKAQEPGQPTPDGSGPPPPDEDGNFLYGVSALASDEVWAVGMSDPIEPGGDQIIRTLALRWNGTQWSQVGSASPSPDYNAFYAVDAVARGDAWAVGSFTLDNYNYDSSTLIARYNVEFCPTATPTATTAPTITPTPCTGSTDWTIISNPNRPSSGFNQLVALGVVAPNDIWAVGSMIQHWDGNSWTLIQTDPNFFFNDIEVVSANDIWAVGSQTGYNGAATFHWDGTSWSQIPNVVTTVGSRLYGVAAVASNNVWAVGEDSAGIVIIRWNGSAWSRSTFDLGGLRPSRGGGESPGSAEPDGTLDTHLEDIAVVGPNDIWAVGTLHLSSDYNTTLIMHYNGQGWSVVSSPNVGLYANLLTSLTVVSPTDIWAVGYSRDAYGQLTKTLILRWNGTQWSVVPSPNPTGGLGPNAPGDAQAPSGADYSGHFLYSVDALSANEIWAVGKHVLSFSNVRTLALRWNGTEWTHVTTPSDTAYTRLTGVAVLAPNYAWAVGFRGGQGYSSMTMRLGPPCGSTPLPTNTPLAVTNTPNLGTATRTNLSVTATRTPVVPTSTPLPCNLTRLFFENFDTYAGTMGPHFTNDVPVCTNGLCDWWVEADRKHSAPYAVDAPAPGNTSDQRLVMTTPIAIPAGASQPTLRFQQHEQFSGGDGGVLEVSTNGGTTWADIGAANFIANGYTGTLSGSGNPLAGRAGWVGYTPDNTFREVVVNLAPYAGQSIKLRWRLGTDNSVGTWGWAIDDIQITVNAGASCPTNSSTPTNTPVPSGTPATSTPRPSFTPTPSPTCGPGWAMVQSPNYGNGHNRLNDVVTISTNDVWAVGYGGGTLHWNGVSWSIVTNPAGEGTDLEGVDALSSNDVWAVGSYIYGYSSPLAMHWDGATWTIFPTPFSAGSASSLSSVAMVSTNDVWAVGEDQNGPMIMHWNGTAWTIVPNGLTDEPNRLRPGTKDEPQSYYNALFDVEAVSANDVWAVGTRNETTLALHWNGTQWTRVNTPSPSNDDSLRSLSVISANDIWAVGHKEFYIHPRGGIAQHWNGTAWTSVPVPAGNIGLFGVEAVSPTEVWAVGIDNLPTYQYDYDAVIMKWNGATWSRVPSPNPTYSSRDELYGISAVGPGDIWAVGMFDFDTVTDRYYGIGCGTPAPATHTPTSTRTSTPTRTHTPTVTGTPPTATVTRTPRPVTGTPSVAVATNTQAVSTNTPTGATATAQACLTTFTGAITGSDPTQAGRINTLLAASTCDNPRAYPGTFDTLARRYDTYTFTNNSSGAACYTVRVDADCLGDNVRVQSATYLGSFNPADPSQNYLADIGPTLDPVGQYSFSVPAGATFVVVVNEFVPLVGCSGYTLMVAGPGCPLPPLPTPTSIIPTLTVTPPVPSVTVGVPLPTVTLPVPTATVGLPLPTVTLPVPGACDMSFSDVPVGSTFYTYAMCLACGGTISGYSDGTFRPNASVTRGQLSKIVAGAAQYRSNSVGQSFEDVPPSNTFYAYIERIAASGLIGGYACGGPGEACGEGNRPYFRPGSNATRGQISKIVAGASQLRVASAGEQMFEDVPPTSTFYAWVQALGDHGMMSGYPCGGPGEACGEGNRPYFRPGALATRGQVSKIVANAFSPECARR